MNDMRHGQGTLVSGNSKYVGSWVNDKKHGLGKYSAGAYTIEGEYADD